MANVFGIKRKQFGVGEITLPLTMSKAIHALTKMELDQIRQYYGFQNTSNLKKQQLAEAIIADLPSRMIEGLSSLNQELFELVQRIIELGGIWQVDEFPLDKAWHLMKIGLVFPGLYKGKNVLVVPTEQMEIFRFFVVGESGPKYEQIKMQFSNVISFPKRDNMNQQRDLDNSMDKFELLEDTIRISAIIWLRSFLEDLGCTPLEAYYHWQKKSELEKLLQDIDVLRGGFSHEKAVRELFVPEIKEQLGLGMTEVKSSGDWVWSKPEYELVAALLERESKYFHSPLELTRAIELWYEYTVKQGPRFNKADIWAATLDFILQERQELEPTFAQVAGNYRVSAQSVSKAYYAMGEVLDLDEWMPMLGK